MLLNEKKLHAFLQKARRTHTAFITDFDRTLSMAKVKGKDAPTSVGVVRESALVPKQFAQDAFSLYKRFRPIELDATLSLDAKGKLMEEWYSDVRDLYVEHGLTKRLIEKIIQQDSLPIRRGMRGFAQVLSQKEIPLLIVSAGNTDIIEGALRRKRIYRNNMTIVANTMEFDSKGYMTGYKNDIVHTCNKDLFIHLALQPKLNHIFVMGDALEDAQMASHLRYAQFFKIGFCHDITKASLYKKVYDMVLFNDCALTQVTKILSKIR
jgi:HAD superfamily hydrolase (TIGR01544 family)